MKQATRPIILAAWLVAALSHNGATAQLLGISDDEYTVYSAYIAARRPTDGSRVRFALSTPTVAIDRQYLADLSPDMGVDQGCTRMPRELLGRLRTLGRETLDLNAHWLRGVEVGVLTRRQFEATYGGSARDDWPAFDRDYPNSYGLHRVSRVAFDDTRTWALFYESYDHGGMNAGGGLVVMQYREGHWTKNCFIALWDS